MTAVLEGIERRELDGLEHRAPMFSVTFDVDAEALWLTVTRKPRPALVSQGLYGLNEGIPRILSLLADTGATATFFVPGLVAERHPSLVPELIAAGHEVASHGYSHMPLSALESREAEERELRMAKDILEAQGGKPVVGFGAAVCDVSAYTLDILMDQGIAYDRSFLDSDWPYAFVRGGDRLVELPVSWVMDDFTFFGHNIVPKLGWGIQEPEMVGRIWRGEMATFRDGGGFCCLVMHPEVIGRRSRLPVLRDLITEFSEAGKFLSCAEIARLVSTKG
ncbi:MAG: polysaccharide deacetylase family protein [Rhizobiaceae bacterium]